MPRSPLRIAILECDTPLDGTRAKYGSYGGVFTALLRAAAAASFDEDPASTLGPPPDYGLDISRFDVEKVEQYPRVEDVDAVLLTGSNRRAGVGDAMCAQ
ncbi:MAG: hypothetical protein M1837_001759 [Sclerophora amabilis]|nr:MAG: hypothetical protein M1837_001759 [Sclerophora amabilis]